MPSNANCRTAIRMIAPNYSPNVLEVEALSPVHIPRFVYPAPYLLQIRFA